MFIRIIALGFLISLIVHQIFAMDEVQPSTLDHVDGLPIRSVQSSPPAAEGIHYGPYASDPFFRVLADKYQRRLMQEPIDELKTAYQQAIDSLKTVQSQDNHALKIFLRSRVNQLFSSVDDRKFDQVFFEPQARDQFCAFALKHIESMLKHLKAIEVTYDDMMKCFCCHHKQLCLQAVKAYEDCHYSVRGIHSDSVESFFFEHFNQPMGPMARFCISAEQLKQRCREVQAPAQTFPGARDGGSPINRPSPSVHITPSASTNSELTMSTALLAMILARMQQQSENRR